MCHASSGCGATNARWDEGAQRWAEASRRKLSPFLKHKISVLVVTNLVLPHLSGCGSSKDFLFTLAGRSRRPESAVAGGARGARPGAAAGGRAGRAGAAAGEARRRSLPAESAPAARTGALQEVVLRAAGGPVEIERRVGASAARLRRGTGAETGAPGGGRGGQRARRGITAGEAAQGPARVGQLRQPSGHHARLRVERGRAGLPVLRGGAERDRGGRELADRVPAGALRAPSARPQEVRLCVLRSFGAGAADAGGGAGRLAHRARPGRAGTAGVHRHQQVRRLLAALPAGRYFRPPGIRDFARHAVGLVRGRGRPGRALVPAHGRARAAVARGGHRRHGAAHAESRQDAPGADVGLRGRRRASLQRFRLHPAPQPRRTARVSEKLYRGAAGRRLRRLQRGGGGQRPDPRRVLVACASEG